MIVEGARRKVNRANFVAKVETVDHKIDPEDRIVDIDFFGTRVPTTEQYATRDCLREKYIGKAYALWVVGKPDCN